MKPEDKFAYASTSGICTMFVSCVGLNIKEDFSNSSSVFFDPIMCASAISGLVVTMPVFIGITLYECYKEHKEKGIPFGKNILFPNVHKRGHGSFYCGYSCKCFRNGLRTGIYWLGYILPSFIEGQIQVGR